MISFKITNFKSLATRESAATARGEVERELSRAADLVTMDFQGAQLTPSFADEFVGRLAEHLGERQFRERVKLVNVDESLRPLLNQVISRRLHRAHAA